MDELTDVSFIGGDMYSAGMPFLGVVVRKGTVVGSGNNIQRSCLYFCIFYKQDRSHMTAQLICVCTAEDQAAASLLLPLKHINLSIPGSTS